MAFDKNALAMGKALDSPVRPLFCSLAFLLTSVLQLGLCNFCFHSTEAIECRLITVSTLGRRALSCKSTLKHTALSRQLCLVL